LSIVHRGFVEPMSNSDLPIPAAPARAEIRAGNSRFIASAAPTDSVAAARSFIAAIRQELPDATHHVFAYRIGHGASIIEGMSDDGEPSGTAGRPVLAVVRGSGLGDLTVVVTRYFGGTLLGTGGLVRAYGDAAKAVLAVLPRAAKIERAALHLTLDYSSYDVARRLIAAYGGTVTDETFAADVTIDLLLPAAQIAALTAALEQATAGRATIAPRDD
jgi:uncharacterized YigZ family protein